MGSAADELEALIDARVQEKGSAVFAAMHARIRELEAECALLKQILGVPGAAAVLVPDSGDNDDPLDLG